MNYLILYKNEELGRDGQALFTMIYASISGMIGTMYSPCVVDVGYYTLSIGVLRFILHINYFNSVSNIDIIHFTPPKLFFCFPLIFIV